MINKSELAAARLKEYGIAFRTDMCGKACTSFRIGGPLGVFAEPDSAEMLCAAINAAKELDYPYFVIGNGSNLLIPDDGVDALFVKPSGSLAGAGIDGLRLKAGAGVSLAATAKLSIGEGLMGLEWASGIPGTIGGTVAMNAGAYGGEIRDVIRSVTVLKDGCVKELVVKPSDMGYRRSAFAFPGCVVLYAEFELRPDDGGAAERMRDYNERRREKQPVELPSAGSTFKRPEGYYAAALIDGAGLKGVSVGGAQVSPKHAGFIVNTGGATYSDVIALMELVKNEVYKRFGVELEPEIKIL